MKKNYVHDLLVCADSGAQVHLLGWIGKRRHHGKVIFLDVMDSTGMMQVVVDRERVQKATFLLARDVPIESAIKVIGVLRVCAVNDKRSNEIHASTLEIVSKATRQSSPPLRGRVRIFDPAYADHLLRNRHLYIRNPQVMAILRFRHLMMGAIHTWFRHNGYVEITAPVLTPVPLYEDETAMALDVHDERVFLTQCVGFYLEAAVHAFERVYNIGPSFRAEESRSKRHLMEYWHIKAELAWVDLDDLAKIVEDLISHIVQFSIDECEDITKTLGTKLCVHGMATPFPRISYGEAVDRLKKLGVPFEFGTSLGSNEEEILSKQFASPFWITGIPRTIEPFPYVIDKDDPRVTRTADLIATNGYGELLGIAEKIHDPFELEERMKEKGKVGDARYNWVRQMRDFGCVPHGGFGMGVERFIRWLLDIPHVRDTIPFPRIFRRKIMP